MLAIGDYAKWGTAVGKVVSFCRKPYTSENKVRICQLKFRRGGYSYVREDDLEKIYVSNELIEEQKNRLKLIADLKKQLKEEEGKLLNWL